MNDQVIRLRDAGEADISRIAEILNATWTSVWAEPMGEEATRAWNDGRMADKVARAVWRLCIVAEAGGSIRGFVCIDGDEVATLHVDPEISRHGIGRALMAAAEARVSSAGLGELRLETEAFNSGAHAFYAALGYHETRRFTGKVIGYPVACIEMRKDL